MGPKKVLAGEIESNPVLESIQKILERLSIIENKIDESNSHFRQLEDRLSAQEAKVVEVAEDLSLLSSNYNRVLERISVLEEESRNWKQEAIAMRCAVNKIQQRNRIFTIRILNMKDEVKNSREAALYLYDALFKKILTDPQGVHPGHMRVVEFAHLLPRLPGKEQKYTGFNYIVRLHGRYFKLPIIENKKAIADAYNVALGANVKIQQDFTYVNRQALSFLHKQDEVGKVTFRGDRLMIKLAAEGDDAAWKEVINPFSRRVAEMI